MNRTTTVLEPTGKLPEIASLLHDLRNPLSTISASAEVLIGTDSLNHKSIELHVTFIAPRSA
jgi:K+-sensing histidine kinase KdpD